MFALFFSLYYSMFVGSWTSYTNSDISSLSTAELNKIGLFLTSIFGDNTMNELGDAIMGLQSNYYFNYFILIALVLATITSIGIVVMAVKGVKKAFGIFFMGIRR